MNTKFPNYDDCITNLSCSLLKHFEVPYKHNTIKEVDEMLECNPKNVVVILFDGMGYHLINRILDEDSVIRTNMVKCYSSVSPSTTTASTTSMLSGLNPVEHGWLGWNVYFEPIDKIVTLYTNKLKGSEEDAETYNVADHFLPYKNLKEQVKEGPYDASIIFPFGNEVVYDGRNLDDMNDKIVGECNKSGKRLIYVYHEDPDTTLHLTGTKSKETIEMFKKIDESLKSLVGRLKDTVLIVTADHGHMNSLPYIITDYKDFFDTLDGDTSIESRFCSFKVKDGKEEDFVRLFNKYFSNDFVLKTKEEIINEGWFGTGEENKYFRSALGDYFALAKSDRFFIYENPDNEDIILKSNHAGISEDEIDIPLVMKRIR